MITKLQIAKTIAERIISNLRPQFLVKKMCEPIVETKAIKVNPKLV